MSRTQWKVMGVLAGLVAAVVIVSGVLAERGLRERETARIAESLHERAELVRELVRGRRLEPGAMEGLDDLADRAGAAAEARVTLIAPDGRVVGDSHVPASRLPGVESHAGRPEVREALAGRAGRSMRRSRTVGERLLYVALPSRTPGGGVVRVAVDLEEVEAAAAGLRAELLTAGAVGLGAALALSFGLARLALRPLQRMRAVAASIARGDLGVRLPWSSGDELGELGRAINQMAEQLRLRLEDLASGARRLEAVLDAMAEGVLVVDAAGKILLANPRLRELFGVSQEMVGRRVLEVIRSAELDALLARAAGGGGPVSHELVLGDGEPRTLRVQAVAFEGGGERHAGVVAVFHDVTQGVRLEKVRRDFIANASHELRTPLTAVRGFAETLLGGERLEETERRSYLEIIDRHARRLESLVDDLLELSRIESREQGLALRPVDPAGVARGLVRDLRPRFEEKRLAVTVDDAESAPVRGDPRALEQVLANLLDNALKYTEPGGRVGIRFEREARSMRVHVTDTGVGIPEADLGRVFERFYRVDKARSRALGGTGLGLSIVKHLVQAMHGEVSVGSEPGRGSTFTVRLPRAEPAAPPASESAGPRGVPACGDGSG